MKFLHTADWHIGQLFHEYDRHHEHQQFLSWMVQTLRDQQIDVLLISGDIFDLANPSAAAIKLFYTFLQEATRTCPDLQIIVTAGNHDSAARLEAPKPLLDASNIHIVGLVPRTSTGDFDYDAMTIPIRQVDGAIFGWCLAIPFLRMGDYPTVAGSKDTYADGVAALYHEAMAFAKKQAKATEPIIALGHLTARDAEITDLDKSERLIMGGIEHVPGSAFPEGLSYVALGHIHKAQRIGGAMPIRYSGSPIPMSFGERGYQHQVLVFDLFENGEISEIESIAVPVTIPLLTVPEKHRPLNEVIAALSKLETEPDLPLDLSPYLMVKVLLEGPEPSLRHQIEQVLEDKNVRLAKIDVRYPQRDHSKSEPLISPEDLMALKPLEIFNRHYEKKYNMPLPENLLKKFNEIATIVEQRES